MSRRSSSSSTSTRSDAEAPRPSSSAGRSPSSHGSASRGSTRPPSRDSDNARPASRDSGHSRPPSRDSANARPPSRDSRDSSHSRTSSRDSNAPDNTRGHQGLFLPDYEGSPFGTLYHINIQNGGLSGTLGKHGYEVKAEGYTMSTSNAKSAFIINGAMVTNNMVRRATQHVFDNGGNYNMLFNNCQHFCLESIIYMNRVWPENVGPEAIAHLQVDRPSTMVAMTSMIGRNRAAPAPAPAPGPGRRDSRRSDDRFSIN
ncbi:hypothetical protein B0T21DRAFT_358117 [Apiosordaria backusii]|uniref:PPPDE domain-containing protein n=1 Tax=Apiosordaria backusii TaxID=314023 RepID=A0AA40ESF0_9PEZI|nr:hypothetical protein B0T21DRAFT_358117 [Apiosordaria backusii]